MQYVYEKDGKYTYPVSFGQFLSENPGLNVSFANDPNSESLKDFGLHVPEQSPQPDHNEDTHKLELEVLKTGGKYRQRWKIIPLSQEEKNRKNDQKALEVRIERNQLLSRYIDPINPIMWESLPADQKAKRIAYRQALLDVPQQAGFPWNVTWPNPPE